MEMMLMICQTCFIDLKHSCSNRKEFVEAYVNYAFNTSVERVFQEFKRGFFQVCDRDLVKLFRPKELQGVLVGKDFHDWAMLKEVHSKQELIVFLHVLDSNTIMIIP